jgi:hypothetical protein
MAWVCPRSFSEMKVNRLLYSAATAAVASVEPPSIMMYSTFE